MEGDLGSLKKNVESTHAEHAKWGTWDAYLYNGGTGFVLLCTGIATYLPATNLAVADWLPQILTGLATFWVALDRALTFGPRWKFHLTQRSGYRRVLDQIAVYCSVAEDKKPSQLEKIISQLDAVRSQEPGMPGIDVTSDR